MANERQWDAVGPILLTADGSTEGVLQVVDTAGFFFDAQATLKNNAGAQLTVYIKRVVDNTTLWVGPKKGGLDHNVDVSAFTVATASTIFAAMQNKPTVPMEARLQSTYVTDPVDAWRVQNVDPYGNPYTDSNPLPIAFDGTITIGDVTVIGTAPNHYPLEPNSDGSLNVDLNPLDSFQTSQYSVGPSAVPLTVTPLTNRQSVSIKALTTSSAIVYIGNSNSVTTSTGYPLLNGDSLNMDLDGVHQIWAIASLAGQTVCVLELA